MRIAQTKTIVGGGLAGALAVGLVLAVGGEEKDKDSALTVEEWCREYSAPFHRQMSTWRSLSEDLGTLPLGVAEAAD
ncbi:hypothetical protein V5S96_03035 [Corynebacterium mastitidis]|uniref:Uncharacterized protein n=1 Tax=Corynebacterium mastitidis TaxID=161890 RepID=A0ABU8NY89_9CORY